MERIREEEEEEAAEGFFDKLPYEIVVLILEKVSDAKDLFVFSLLSKRLAELVPQIRVLSFTVPPPSPEDSPDDDVRFVAHGFRLPNVHTLPSGELGFAYFPKILKDDKEDPSLSGLLRFISRCHSVEVLKIEFSLGDLEIAQTGEVPDQPTVDREKYCVRWSYNVNSKSSKSIVGLAVGDDDKAEEFARQFGGGNNDRILEEVLTLCLVQPLRDGRALMFFLLRLLDQPTWFPMLRRLKRVEMTHRDSRGNGGRLVVREEFLIQLKNKKEAEGGDAFANLYKDYFVLNGLLVHLIAWFVPKLRLPQHRVTRSVMQFVFQFYEDIGHECERGNLLEDAFGEEEFQLEAAMEIAKRPPFLHVHSWH